MSTVSIAKQSQSTSSSSKSRPKVQLRLRVSQELDTDSGIAVTTSNVPSPPSIFTEHKDKDTAASITGPPYKIHSRPRYDSSEDEDQDRDQDREMNSKESNRESKPSMNNLSTPIHETQATDSWVSQDLSFSDDTVDDHKKHEPAPEPEPECVDRHYHGTGFLMRRKAKLDVLRIEVHHEVEALDHDEYHPEQPQCADDDDEGWHQKSFALFGAAQSDNASLDSDNEPTTSIFGALLKHQTMHNLKDLE